jgi:hypothetical protein
VDNIANTPRLGLTETCGRCGVEEGAYALSSSDSMICDLCAEAHGAWCVKCEQWGFQGDLFFTEKHEGPFCGGCITWAEERRI